MHCPPREGLKKYLSGELDSASLSAFRAHVETCADCRRAVSQHEDETVGGDFPAPTALPGTDQADSHSSSSPLAETAIDLDGLPMGLLAPALAAGEIGRLAHYRVIQLLGSGGMGMVFLAEDTRLQRRVALKVMRPDLTNQSMRRRFLREARACAAIESEHIVTVHQVDEDRGVPFLAMQYLKGEPLNVRLKRLQRLPLADAIRIAREVATGLAAAHAAGLIHRDIKPGNLWLEVPADRVKILDFGLARPLEAEQAEELTTTGNVLGTAGYMAPEQADGRRVDARTDLFSLGCVIYEMAIGRPPYRAKGVLALLHELAVQKPPTLREVDPTLPDSLSDLVERMMAADPAARPQSAVEVGNELAVIQRDVLGERERTIATDDENALFSGLIEDDDRPRLPPSRHPNRFSPKVLAGIAVLAAVIGVAIYFGTRKGSPPSASKMVIEPEAKEEKKKESRPAPITNATELPRDEDDREMLAKLSPAVQATRMKEGLARVNRPGFNPNRPGSFATDTLGGKNIRSVEITADGLTDLHPLRALPVLTHVTIKAGGHRVALKGLAGLPLAYLSVQNAVVDLAELGAMPTLKHLGLEGSKITHPEQTSAGVEYLELSRSDVADVGFVKKLPALRKLDLHGTAVADLSALPGSKLEWLDISECAKIKDIGPLSAVPLSDLRCSFQPAFAKILMAHKTLRTINGMPVDEFFKDASPP